MAFLRFTRDRRGYEHFYLVEPAVNRRGRTEPRVLYWFRTPPNVKVGREPFDSASRRALEREYPDVRFDWPKILETPIPSADVERWREKRRVEKAEKAARRAAATSEGAEESDELHEDDAATPPTVRELGADGAVAAETAPGEANAAGPPVSDSQSSSGSREGRRRRRRRGRRSRPDAPQAHAATEPHAGAQSHDVAESHDQEPGDQPGED